MPKITLESTTYDLNPTGPRNWGREGNDWAEHVSTLAASASDAAADRGELVVDIREDYPTYNSLGVATGGTTLGALPGSANAAYTTRALQNLLNSAKHLYNPPDGTAVVGRTIAIYIPFEPDDWYINPGALTAGERTTYFGDSSWADGLYYQGNAGYSIKLIGELSLTLGETSGTKLIWNGGDGDYTLFKFVAANGLEVRDLTFDGNYKARRLVWLRQKSATGVQYAGSAGADFFNCKFLRPNDDSTSALIQAGHDEGDGNTYQASEYRFHQCYITGSGQGSYEGWGFRAMVGGNTQNFLFRDCKFSFLYRAIEGLSGNIAAEHCTFSNINTLNRAGGGATCMYAGGGSVWNVMGCDFENLWPAQFLTAAQGTVSNVKSCQIAACTPVDDVVISVAGPATIQGCTFGENNRAGGVYGAPLWASGQTVILNDERYLGSNAYRLTTVGTGITTGAGPVHTTGAVADANGNSWTYYGPATSNSLEFATSEPSTTGGRGGFIFENNQCRYASTAVVYPPIKNANREYLCGHVDPDKDDFSHTVSSNVRCYGNVEGSSVTGYNAPMANVNCDPDYGPSIRDGVLISLLKSATSSPNGNNSDGTAIRTLITVSKNVPNLYKLVIPYTAFKAAALTKEIILGLLPHKRRIIAVHAEVTTAFAYGGGGTLTMSVGTQDSNGGPSDPDRLLLGWNCGSTGVKGKLAADMGVGFSNGQGGHYTVDSGGYNSSGEVLQVTLTSSSGNLSTLTQGSLTLIFKHERVGL